MVFAKEKPVGCSHKSSRHPKLKDDLASNASQLGFCNYLTSGYARKIAQLLTQHIASTACSSLLARKKGHLTMVQGAYLYGTHLLRCFLVWTSYRHKCTYLPRRFYQIQRHDHPKHSISIATWLIAPNW